MDITELDALLGAAKRPEKRVKLCLRGDLQAQWEELDDRLTDVRAATARTMAGSSEETEIAREMRDLESEMESATLTLTLRALPHRQWLKLVRSHPERRDHPEDKALGVNQDTFFDAMITACLVDPELSEEQLSRLLDSITGAQYDKLTTAAWTLNRQDVDIPFSPIASRITSNSDEASKRQPDSGSRQSGSRAGSRKK